MPTSRETCGAVLGMWALKLCEKLKSQQWPGLCLLVCLSPINRPLHSNMNEEENLLVRLLLAIAMETITFLEKERVRFLKMS